MRCGHCPAPAGELCRGEAVPHFCDLVNPAHPKYTPAYVRILIRDDVQLDPRRQRPTVAESVALARRMNACPYRSVGPNVGCGCGQCGLRKGASVNHLECFACLEAYP